MTSFNDLGLAEPILRAISAAGYSTPTPIQSGVIPDMLGRRDIVGIAQTGTGKTAAFVLPMLNRILLEKRRPDAKSCPALILAPTRELAAQIADNIRVYSQFIHASVTVIVGGVKPRAQIRNLARGVDIVVATPGRLEDHISTGALKLDQTHTIVLDEADQMMDLGFMPAIRRIMKLLPHSHQTVLLSATMPKQIRALAKDFLSDPAEISVAPQSRPIERIDQKVYFVGKQAKRQLLEELVEHAETERVIVFTRTKHGANKVVINLEKRGLTAAAIHGNKSQSQRQKTLNAFRKGELNILVATDIAARGIDIDDISHIINYELPNIPESYVHRIGRTARAGKSGIAISLCDPTERSFLRDIEKLTGRAIERLDSAYRDTYDPTQEGLSPTPRGRGNSFRKKPRPNHKSGGNHHGKPNANKAQQGRKRPQKQNRNKSKAA